jgi:hypothetical protein
VKGKVDPNINKNFTNTKIKQIQAITAQKVVIKYQQINKYTISNHNCNFYAMCGLLCREGNDINEVMNL